MIISKTQFINYLRCKRYVALEDIEYKKDKSLVTFNSDILDIMDFERKSKLNDLINNMPDIDVVDIQLETMLPYFKQVEIISAEHIKKHFGDKVIYSLDTKEQKMFEASMDDYKYICYVDGYQEKDNGTFNIFEVKSTTSSKFLKLGKKGKHSIFKEHNGILRLIDEVYNNYGDLTEKEYKNARKKLLDRKTDVGKYVYDLAFQRFVIESHLKENNKEDIIKDIKYYLVVLNSKYVFNGKYENGQPKYDTDNLGNEIVSFIDLTKVTDEMQDIVNIDRKNVEAFIDVLDADKCDIGDYCLKGKTTECKYINICWDFIPNKNSILTYMGNHNGFKDEEGYKWDRYELLNKDKVNMLDIPSSWLTRPNNIIQHGVVKNGHIYKNSDKIKSGLELIKYPIYHLDFETFPCPLPRFKGEKCYSQSVFQFSIHVEKEEGICDKDLDHYEFLSPDHNDRREELLIKMLEIIDVDKGGTILVYNQAFEVTRLKELADIFPKYKKDITKMINMIFDLMHLVKTNSTLYERIGYTSDEAKVVNFYHEDLNGSYSIKKVLPVFSDLKYDDLDIGNGVEALVTYANYDKFTEHEYKSKYQALVEYCKQDTWAMVEILDGLRKMI